MSLLVTFNGTVYSIPQANETGWSSLTNFLQDVGNNAVSAAATQTLSNKTISFANGIVGAPSITFTADTTTGIYSPGSHQLALSTAGIQAISISATQAVNFT